MCKKLGDPVYLTKNMDIFSFVKREKMLKLREELLSVEEERLGGNYGFIVNELEKSLNYILRSNKIMTI